MTGLHPIDRELLNFICSCAHHRVRVVRVKAPRAAALRRLRDAGLVSFEGFQPSQRALADWLERQQTPAPSVSKAPAEPPEPEAATEGGGAARCVAPPPKRSAKKFNPARARPAAEAPRHRAHECEAGSGASLAGQPRLIANIQGASGTARKAPSVEETNSAKRIEDRAPPIKPPAPYSPEKQDFLRGNAARLRAGRERAEAFLDSGRTAQDAGSVTLRIEVRKLEVWRAEEARRNDPLEQAKTLIRRKTRHAVFGAEVSMGEAGKGRFFIGNKLVSEAELFAMAKRLAA